jgi:hypothetical protein
MLRYSLLLTRARLSRLKEFSYHFSERENISVPEESGCAKAKVTVFQYGIPLKLSKSPGELTV